MPRAFGLLVPLPKMMPAVAVAVPLGGAAALHVGPGCIEVLVRTLDSLVDVAANALAGVARPHRLDVVTAALNAGVVHVDLGHGPAVDPEHLVHARDSQQLVSGERRFEEDTTRLLVLDAPAEGHDAGDKPRLVGVLVDDDDVVAARWQLAIAVLGKQTALEPVRRMVEPGPTHIAQGPHPRRDVARHAHDVRVVWEIAVDRRAGGTHGAAHGVRRPPLELHDPQPRAGVSTQRGRDRGPRGHRIKGGVLEVNLVLGRLVWGLLARQLGQSRETQTECDGAAPEEGLQHGCD